MTSAQLIAAIVSMLYITRITPRKILLIRNFGMSLSCFAIGISLIIAKSNFKAFWSLVAFLSLFMVLNGGTFIPAIGLYVAEVGSRSTIRWSLVTNWITCGVTIIIFMTVGSKFSYSTVFMIFGITSMVGFIVNMFFMI